MVCIKAASPSTANGCNVAVAGYTGWGSGSDSKECTEETSCSGGGVTNTRAVYVKRVKIEDKNRVESA